MATSEVNWSILASATVVLSALGALAAAVYHFIFKKAQRQTTDDNQYNLINDRLTSLEQRHDDLVANIEKYRDSQTDRLDEIISNQNKLSNDIAFIRGKLEGPGNNHS